MLSNFILQFKYLGEYITLCESPHQFTFLRYWNTLSDKVTGDGASLIKVAAGRDHYWVLINAF